MIRTIAVAAVAFAVAAFVLHRAALGAFEEPLLLLALGTVFLFAARLLGQHADQAPSEDGEAELVPERRRTA